MANVTTTEAAGFIPEIWAATALGALQANTVMLPLVDRNFENEFHNVGDILNVPRRGTISVNDKAANTDITLQTPTADTIPLTLNKHKDVSFAVEDIAQAQANQDIISGYVMDGMIALAHQIDDDILALYSGFSTTPLDARTGSGGVTVNTIIEAQRLFNKALVPQTGRAIVWGEDAHAELLKLGQFTNAQYDPANANALQMATLGMKYGFMHYMDQRVVQTGGEVKNLAFHKNAIMFASRPLALPPAGHGVTTAVMNESGIGIRVMYGYSILKKAMIVSLDVLYGVAEERDNHGLVIRSTDI
ncbi:MAG: P22 phage major capsid protein family protein [Caldilineaceae bacterium]